MTHDVSGRWVVGWRTRGELLPQGSDEWSEEELGKFDAAFAPKLKFSKLFSSCTFWYNDWNENFKCFFFNINFEHHNARLSFMVSTEAVSNNHAAIKLQRSNIPGPLSSSNTEIDRVRVLQITTTFRANFGSQTTQLYSCAE